MKVKVKKDMRVRADLVPSSINEDERTADFCFGTENPVRTYTYEGLVWEILSFDDGHCDLSRLEAGAPFLDNHNRYGSVLDCTLGVISRAWVDNRAGYCTVRFDDGEKGAEAFRRVKNGTLRNVSVGYGVTKYERTVSGTPGEMDTFRAIEWQPKEISLVPVGADQDAQVRSENQEKTAEFSEVEYITTNLNITATRNMKKGTETEGDDNVVVVETPAVDTPQTPVTAPPAGDVDGVRAAATVAERTRVSEINDAVRAAGLEQSFADEHIKTGTSADSVRKAVIEKFANMKKDSPETVSAHVGADRQRDGARAAISDALFIRAEPNLAETVNEDRRRAAHQYRSLSMLDLARSCVENMGVSTVGMDKMEIVARAITSSTSDFPVLLEGTNRRVLLAAYESIPDTWRQFAMVGSVSDFRPHSRLRTGSFSRLDKVMENAEYKNKPIPDGDKEGITAETYGNIINVSRKMIINDDLNAFVRLASMLGRAAARSIEIDIYNLFALNAGAGPTMGDGNPLFHASHGNIAAVAAAPSVTSFDAARVQMAQQKDISGNDFIDVRPSIWLGPVGLGGAVNVINGSQYDTEVSNKFMIPNKVVGLFRKIIDTPRLSGTAWYALASVMEEPVFEVAFLDGVQTPYMEQREGFTVDGMEWKVRLDYGVGAIGWRGIVKNAGA